MNYRMGQLWAWAAAMAIAGLGCEDVRYQSGASDEATGGEPEGAPEGEPEVPDEPLPEAPPAEIRGFIADVARSGDALVVINVYNGVDVMGIGPDGGLSALGHQFLPTRGLHRVAVEGELAYVASLIGLTVLDVSDPSAPQELGSDAFSGAGLDLALTGGPVALRTEDSVRLVDVSDPSGPVAIQIVPVAQVDIPRIAANDEVVVINTDEGFEMRSLTEPIPLNPVVTFGAFAEGPAPIARDAEIAGDLLAMGWSDGKIHLRNIETPYRTWQTGELVVPGDATDLKIVGDILLVSMRRAGLAVIDISEVDAPRLVEVLDTPEEAHSATIVNGRAYVADGFDSLQILSLSGAP